MESWSNNALGILCVSDYEPLRITRAHVLRRNGFDVQAVDSQGLEELVDLRCFSLVIVCQSIPAERAAEIAGKTKRLSQGTLLLRVQLTPRREEALIFDAVMEGTSMPQQFVTSVMRMFERPQSFRSA